MKKKILSLICTITLGLTLTGAPVFAQGIKNATGPLSQVGQKTGTDTQTDISTVAGITINAALQLVGLIFMLLLVYAGVLWMTARGEEGQIEKAQKIIIASVIGMIITISAYAVTTFVTSKFEG